MAQQDCMLTSLPSEVIALITSHLSPTHATNLALTCKSLQAHAEPVVWRSLSIKDSDTTPESTRFEGIHPENDYHAKALLLGRAVRNFIAMLGGPKRRMEMVQRLELPIRQTVPSELVALFHLISPTIKELTLTMPVGLGISLDTPTYIPLENVMTTLPRFDNLRKATITIQNFRGSFPGTIVFGLLGSAPRLEELTIINKRLSPMPPCQTLPSLRSPTLRALVVDGPGTMEHLLEHIVRSSPNLTRLELVDRKREWLPSRNDLLLASLVSLAQLKQVTVLVAALQRMQMPWVTEMKDLTIIWDHASLQKISCPRDLMSLAPSTETFTVQVARLAPVSLHEEFFAFTSEGRVAEMLSSLEAEDLVSQPRLHTIRLISPLKERCNRSRTGSDPYKWSSHAFNGVLIYSFCNDKDGREDLVHLRYHYSVSDAECRGKRCLVCPVGWKDKAWWKGQKLPINALSAAYSAGGVNILKEHPGRGLSLPDASWKVLQHWSLHVEVRF